MGEEHRTNLRRGVHIWALLTLAATFLLLCSGGIVTSKGVGMAVPDWPTTYGYNMFLFPVSQWVGGVFYEHTHRLIASGVGMMSMILAVWLLRVEPRRWVKTLGLALFAAACLQGLLGGLRVTLYKDEIGIFHAMLAQAFFCAAGILAVATSPRFIRGKWDICFPDGILRKIVMATTLLVFIQLALGATMRHEHAGLSIPDFPLAYGKWIPDTSEIRSINQVRVANNEIPTSVTQIWIQMAHRFLALLIFSGVAAAAWRVFSRPPHRIVRACATLWLAMIVAQIALGAATVWTNKAADVSTAHMALAALTLLAGTQFFFFLSRGSTAVEFPGANCGVQTGPVLSPDKSQGSGSDCVTEPRWIS